MENELISIVVPIYNVENYLRMCLDSIQNQTYQNFECLLIDDGSPDNSADICREYVAKMLVFVILKKKMVAHLQQEILELNVRQGHILLL